MLAYWLSHGRPHLPKMKKDQTICYISDAGAYGAMYWVFVIGTSISAGAFVVTTVILARWVLLYIPEADSDFPDSVSTGLTIGAGASAIIGSGGAILLAIYDKDKHKDAHHAFLGVFMCAGSAKREYRLTDLCSFGSTVAAILILIVASFLDYQDINEQMKISYYVKFTLTVAASISSAIFLSTTKTLKKRDTAAIAEWTTAALFVLYMSTFVIESIWFPRPWQEDSAYSQAAKAVQRPPSLSKPYYDT